MSLSTTVFDLGSAAQHKSLTAMEASQALALKSLEMASSATRRVLPSSIASLRIPRLIEPRVLLDLTYDGAEMFVANQRGFAEKAFAAVTPD